MGLLNKLFGRKNAAVAPEPAPTELVCLHTSTVAQWDSADDMGHEDRASRFVCGTCGTTFTPDEFAALRATEADRVRELLVTPAQDDTKG